MGSLGIVVRIRLKLPSLSLVSNDKVKFRSGFQLGCKLQGFRKKLAFILPDQA